MIRLLVTSGRGPAECRVALAKALDAMAEEARDAALDLDIAPGPQPPDSRGPRSAIVVIDGDGADVFARHWIGSILWIAQSPIRPHHKRRNWFIGVFELAPPPAAPPGIAPAELKFEAFRAGGPGGQHQNTTESAVRAVHLPSGLSVVARDGRSQHRNKALAITRLTHLIALHAQLAISGDRMLAQAAHDRLERGKPVRRFVGTDFRPVQD